MPVGGEPELPAQIAIRPATPNDLDAIVPLHVAVWRDTYRDLAPAEAVERLDEAARRPLWVAMLGRPGTLAAVDGTALVGFAQVAPAGDAAFEGRPELKYLYVARSHARQGIGRRLLSEAARYAVAQGHRDLGVGVVVGNAPAIRFYEASGARRAGLYRDPGPLWRSDNALYVWDSLAPLV
jgi:ribosomal protein S18 acetylase RimI-like enzyme